MTPREKLEEFAARGAKAQDAVNLALHAHRGRAAVPAIDITTPSRKRERKELIRRVLYTQERCTMASGDLAKFAKELTDAYLALWAFEKAGGE